MVLVSSLTFLASTRYYICNSTSHTAGLATGQALAAQAMSQLSDTAFRLYSSTAIRVLPQITGLACHPHLHAEVDNAAAHMYMLLADACLVSLLLQVHCMSAEDVYHSDEFVVTLGMHACLLFDFAQA